jgi:phosphoribosylglycinamide formyltransferase 2
MAGVDLRVFGKPEVAGKRRLAVTLARADDIGQARALARAAADKLHITVA